jgi:hypothetical protein
MEDSMDENDAVELRATRDRYEAALRRIAMIANYQIEDCAAIAREALAAAQEGERT